MSISLQVSRTHFNGRKIEIPFHNAEIYLNKKPKIDVLASWFLPNHLPLVFMADVNAL